MVLWKRENGRIFPDISILCFRTLRSLPLSLVVSVLIKFTIVSSKFVLYILRKYSISSNCVSLKNWNNNPLSIAKSLSKLLALRIVYPLFFSVHPLCNANILFQKVCYSTLRSSSFCKSTNRKLFTLSNNLFTFEIVGDMSI